MWFRHLFHRSWLQLLFLGGCLSGILVFHVFHQDFENREQVRQRADSELRLIHSVVGHDLQKGQYQAIERFVIEWGSGHADVIQLSVVGKNRFELARYTHPTRVVDADSLTIHKDISYSYQGSATLILVKDIIPLKEKRYRLIGASILVGSLIFLSFFYVIRQSDQRRSETLLLQEQKEKLDRTNEALIREVETRKRVEAATRRDREYQAAIAALLRVAISPFPLDILLQDALRVILELPWLSVRSEGSIFLLDESSGELVLTVSVGMSAAVKTACARVSPGHCHCGRAAASKKPVFSSAIDADHETLYEGIVDHGHYAIPFLHRGQVLGVLNLYLEAGHPHSVAEETFLLSVANTLAGLVQHKRMERETRRLNESLEKRVQERTVELAAVNEKLRASLESQQKMQHHLVESEKMAALGGLVAGIAHEINTPLGIGISASSFMDLEAGRCQEKVAANSLKKTELQRYLKDFCELSGLIQANLQRAAKLVHSFKQVAVDQASREIRRLNLKEYFNEIMFSLRPRLKESGVEVILIGPDDLVVMSDPGALPRILASLVKNSLAHAFEPRGGGRIRLHFMRDGGRVSIFYSDDGKGMDEATRNKIFDPFFTTARARGAIGLGLHVVFNLVSQNLGGKIRCESDITGGTRFIIDLPNHHIQDGGGDAPATDKGREQWTTN